MSQAEKIAFCRKSFRYLYEVPGIASIQKKSAKQLYDCMNKLGAKWHEVLIQTETGSYYIGTATLSGTPVYAETFEKTGNVEKSWTGILLPEIKKRCQQKGCPCE